ncbi:MAG TPA: ABC transporter ATP-binding protein [Bacillota bacterium]
MYLTIDGVKKSFQHNQETLTVLDDIHISIEKGQFVSIVGPSGCGKSTLLYIIAGLVQPDDGAVRVLGKKVTKPSPNRVVVFQEDGLFPWLSVTENVTYGLKLKRLSKEEIKQKAHDVLKMVHLSRYKNAYPHQLSGGMKQRVAIARALVMEPDILLMDEPFAALDEQTRLVLQSELLNIWQKTKVTILFITHNIREAVLLSEKVIVMGTRPGNVKEVFSMPPATRQIVPNRETLSIEQKIFSVLQGEIEKVLKEEMGDDYSFQTNRDDSDFTRHLGSHL